MKLIHWDTLEVLKNIQDNSVDLIATDPPYKTISWWKNWQAKKMGVLKENNGKIFKHNDINIKDYINELYRVLKEWSHCYLMTNNLNLEEFLTESRKAGFKLHNLLIWEKWNKLINRWYMKSFEPILFLRKWPAKKINNLWDDAILRHKNPTNKLHPTEKPVSLMEQMIVNSSNEWDIILDPFMWAWSTWVACKNLNRDFIWIELDEQYFKIAEDRIN